MPVIDSHNERSTQRAATQLVGYIEGRDWGSIEEAEEGSHNSRDFDANTCSRHRVDIAYASASHRPPHRRACARVSPQLSCPGPYYKEHDELGRKPRGEPVALERVWSRRRRPGGRDIHFLAGSGFRGRFGRPAQLLVFLLLPAAVGGVAGFCGFCGVLFSSG
jgi:hypothetical protein